MWDRDYEILTELIVETARVEPTIGNYGKNQVILTETESNPYSITLQSIPEFFFLIKSDEFPAPKTFFNNKKNECKRADYILLCAVEDKKYAIFLELKLGKDNNSDIIDQLKGSLGLFEYCRKMGQIFWDEKEFLEDYIYCFVTIKNIPSPNLRKRKTRVDKNNPLSKSENIKSSIRYLPQKLITFCNQDKFYFQQFLKEILNHLK
jgi:hypothetical protein